MFANFAKKFWLGLVLVAVACLLLLATWRTEIDYKISRDADLATAEYLVLESSTEVPTPEPTAVPEPTLLDKTQETWNAWVLKVDYKFHYAFDLPSRYPNEHYEAIDVCHQYQLFDGVVKSPLNTEDCAVAEEDFSGKSGVSVVYLDDLRKIYPEIDFDLRNDKSLTALPPVFFVPIEKWSTYPELPSVLSAEATTDLKLVSCGEDDSTFNMQLNYASLVYKDTTFSYALLPTLGIFDLGSQGVFRLPMSCLTSYEQATLADRSTWHPELNGKSITMLDLYNKYGGIAQVTLEKLFYGDMQALIRFDSDGEEYLINLDEDKAESQKLYVNFEIPATAWKGYQLAYNGVEVFDWVTLGELVLPAKFTLMLGSAANESSCFTTREGLPVLDLAQEITDPSVLEGQKVQADVYNVCYDTLLVLKPAADAANKNSQWLWGSYESLTWYHGGFKKAVEGYVHYEPYYWHDLEITPKPRNTENDAEAIALVNSLIDSSDSYDWKPDKDEASGPRVACSVLIYHSLWARIPNVTAEHIEDICGEKMDFGDRYAGSPLPNLSHGNWGIYATELAPVSKDIPEIKPGFVLEAHGNRFKWEIVADKACLFSGSWGVILRGYYEDSYSEGKVVAHDECVRNGSYITMLPTVSWDLLSNPSNTNWGITSSSLVYKVVAP